MAIASVKSYADLLRSSLSPSLSWDLDGNVSLLANNLFPNQYLLEFGEDGEAAGWALRQGLPEKIVGDHVGVSRPGSPKRGSISRQTTAYTPRGESWKADAPIFRGGRYKGTDPRKPLPPVVELVPTTTRGFEAGTYGYAYFFESVDGDTTTTAYRYFTLLNNQYPRLVVPETFPVGCVRWGIVLTRKNGGPSRAAIQRRVPVSQLRGKTDYHLYGPWRNRGKAPTRNTSGLGTPKRPVLGRDYERVHSRLDLRAGKWTGYVHLKNERGTSLLSQAGKPVNAKGDPERVPVEGALPVGGPSAQAFQDPTNIRPSGKLAGNEYLGEENDAEESRLVGLLNERRREAGVPDLIVSQVMNRAAYKQALGDEWPALRRAREEGYGGEDLLAVVLEGQSPEEAAALAETNLVASHRWRSVGVARENPGEWHVLVGEPIEDPSYEASDLVCEIVAPDGTVTTHSVDEVRSSTFLSFHLVATFEDGSRGLAYRYSGSYSGSVDTAARRWNAVGPVGVRKGTNPAGTQVAISDGSLESGVYGRTYSDGRMVLNSYYFSRGTANANNACAAHEFGHALGLDHTTIASVLNTPIQLGGGNHETPTSYDVSELKRRWGAGTGGTGGGGQTDPNAPSPGTTQIEINRQQQNKTQTTGPAPKPSDPPEGTESPDPPAIEYRTAEGAYQKNAGIFCRTPRIARRKDVDFTYFFLHEAPDGKVTSYRVYDIKKGKAAYFKGNPGFRGFTVHGYPEDENPKGVRYRMVEEDFPTEDTSVLEAPDPTGVPDPPVASGATTPPAGTYLVDLQGVTESGALTQPSEPVEVTLPPATTGSTLSNSTFRVSAPRTVNLLPNAEFSQLDSSGRPEDWTPLNVGANQPGAYSVTDGVLTIETAAPTSTLPRFDSAKVPVEQGTVLRAAGSLGVTRIPAGSAQAVLREYDDAGAFVRDTVLADLTQIGEVEFGRNFGPGGTAYAATSTQVAILLRMSGASANLTMQAKHLKLLPFASDLRKYEFAAAGSGEADNPDAAPLTPVSASSFVAYGPPPLPPGGDLPEEEPPVEIVGFENGSWSAGWVEFLSGGATASIDAAAAIHGTLGAHFTDPGAGSGVAFRRKTFDSMDGLSFGLRKLIRVPQRPTHGYVTLMRILNTIATQAFVSIRYHSDGRLVLIVFYPAKNLLSGVNLLEGVESGSTIDLEGVVTGLNSKNGLVSVGVGLNGEPRQSVYYEGNIDYRGYFAKTGEVGVAAASDSRARWDLHYDQVVVTKSGDVLNRERPPAPSGFVPPPPDRPRRALLTRTPSTTYAVGDERVPTPYNGHAYVVASQTGPTGTAEPTWPTASGATVVDGGVTWKEAGTSYREFDPDGERGNQAYVFVAPGEGPVTADVLDRPIAVKPGATYPLSVFSRWSVFGDAAPGVKVWLEGDGVEPLLAASLGEMAGTRGWHPTGDEDDSVTFTVPALEYDGSKPLPSYSRARIEATLTEGVYVFQDPAFSQGPLSGFFARDAKRGYGRATTGEIAAILPTFPEAYGAGLDSGVFWSELGVKLASDIDAVTDPNDGVDVFFSTSRDGVLFGPEETVRDAVVTDAYLRIRAVLTGNGRDGPVIPSGGIFLRTWSPLAVLLRPDGSHFPGVAYVDERIYATTYPDAEVARVGGRHQTVETTGDIGRIYDVRIGATTEAAMQEIDRLSLSDELVLELPKAGGTVGGVAYLVRLRGRTKFDPGGLILVNGEHRQMRGIATVEEAEILEAAVLPGPRTNLVAGA